MAVLSALDINKGNKQVATGSTASCARSTSDRRPDRADWADRAGSPHEHHRDPHPARSPVRWRRGERGEPCEEEQDDAVQALSARLVAGDEAALEDGLRPVVRPRSHLRAPRPPRRARRRRGHPAGVRGRLAQPPHPDPEPGRAARLADRHRPAQGGRRAGGAGPRRPTCLRGRGALPDASLTASSATDATLAERLVVRQAVEELPRPAPHHRVPRLLGGAAATQRSPQSIGLPLGTVKSHVRRGLMQLHQQLEGVRHDVTLTSTSSPDLPSIQPTPPVTCATTSPPARSARPRSASFVDVRRTAGAEPLVAAPAGVRAQRACRRRSATTPAAPRLAPSVPVAGSRRRPPDDASRCGRPASRPDWRSSPASAWAA